MAKKEVNRLEGYQENITVNIGTTPIIATIREFKTGSIGYFAAGKTVIDGKKCQVSCNIVIIGTKPTE